MFKKKRKKSESEVDKKNKKKGTKLKGEGTNDFPQKKRWIKEPEYKLSYESLAFSFVIGS